MHNNYTYFKNICLYEVLLTMYLKMHYQLFLFTLLFFVAGLIHRFSGDKSNANFFKILGSDDTSLLIGARNIVYNLALPSLEENVDQVRYHFFISFNVSN